MGRLFDTAAALVGFTRPVSFEGQAAAWLQHRARQSAAVEPYPMPFDGRELDFRPLLRAVVDDRRQGRDPCAIARAFHGGIASGVVDAAVTLCAIADLRIVVLSGGVFQNELLLDTVHEGLRAAGLELWINHQVPPNDGGLSLGQAALAALGPDGGHR
jgi:hydrogenase maturation protein HypF